MNEIPAEHLTRPVRVNVGCGATPTSGWINFDNSVSVRVAGLPILALVIGRRADSSPSFQFIKTARERGIKWANAARRIPLEDGTVEALYSSHMVEHLDQAEARRFLREALRVLMSGGIIRIGVPDISKLVANYVSSGDADGFVERSLLAAEKPKGLIDRMKYLFTGPRHHHWMYDGESMSKLLKSAGFAEAQIVQPGQTRISQPDPLDLWERCEETVYVEAVKP